MLPDVTVRANALPRVFIVVACALLSACGSSDAMPTDAGSSMMDAGEIILDAGPIDAPRRDACIAPQCYVPAESFEYEYTCTGEPPPVTTAPSAEPPVEDCTAGVWPDLDPLVDACPTVSTAMRDDPVSGRTLPPTGDTRMLPVDVPVSESGSFLPTPLPTTWPATLRVVAWNMEYTAHIDEQLDTLTTRPELRDADVYLLSEVDRCSARNGVRRAARELARRISGAYVYGIEFVELSIGRTLGGDTGQAIVSRRPITGAVLTCHSSQHDWFASEAEPRLGQRISLHADIPAGAGLVRVYAVHFESNDVFGEHRVIQVKETLDRAQAIACERPQIIAGDFNTWYPAAPELVVLRNSNFADVLEAAGDTGITRPANRSRLDYIWERGLRTTGGGVLRDVTTSDHYPVWATLEVD